MTSSGYQRINLEILAAKRPIPSELTNLSIAIHAATIPLRGHLQAELKTTQR